MTIDNYIHEHSSPEEQLLRELERETHLRVVHPQMLSGHVQGKLLELLVKMIRPQRVLEIGTFTGYSALCIAAGLEEGAMLDTIEADDELEGIAASFFARSAHGHKIRQHIGSALDVIPMLGGCYDLVFIDGDKREYPDYYQAVMNHIRSGSVIVADNILWYGKVTEDCRDPHTEAIRVFNRMVAADERVENVILPLRDGLNLIRVK